MKVKYIEGQLRLLGSTDDIINYFESKGIYPDEVYKLCKYSEDVARVSFIKRGFSGSELNTMLKKYKQLSERENARSYFLEIGYCNEQIDVLTEAKESGIPIKDLVAVCHPYINSWNMIELLKLRRCDSNDSKNEERPK